MLPGTWRAARRTYRIRAGMAERDVLIVDDDRQVRDLLRQVLLAAGYDCLLASHGNEALDVFRRSRPPLLVTQLILPHRLPMSVMAGFELLEQLRREDPDMAVIVLGHAHHIKTLIECLKQGAAAFILEPMNVEELMLTAGRALERRRLLIEHRQYEQASGQARETSRMPAGADLVGRGALVLVVEEEAAVCDVFRQILVSTGYRCLVTRNCEEGRAAFLESRPDVVIADLGMPMARGGDRVRDAGIALLRQILQEDPDATVIVASGWPDSTVVVESLKRGAFAFLTKPVIVDEMLITVERAVEYRELLIERRRRGAIARIAGR
jgi:DNA-binding NtrC family response regulator